MRGVEVANRLEHRAILVILQYAPVGGAVAVANGAIGIGGTVTSGAGVGTEGVAVGTLTVGNDSLRTAVAVGIAVGVGAGLMSAVPTPYVYTICPPRCPI